MNLFKMLLLILAPLVAFSEPVPFDFKYPTTTKELKLKEQRYNKLEVYITGTGYKSVYGHTWSQNFKYPKMDDSKHNKAVKDFFS